MYFKQSKGEKMNECYLKIEIVSKIDFKFILYQKQKSIVTFEGKLSNNSIINILAYDELADYIYSKQPKIIWLRGELNENMKVCIKEIYKVEIFS